MKVSDALSLIGLGNQPTVTYKEAKAAYRKAATKYHPDKNPAGLQMMQAITEAWRYLEPLLKEHESLKNGQASDNNQANDYAEELSEAINAIINLEGLIIEVCGSWVWVSGDTKPHKDTIKAAGYKWAAKKKMWHYRPANYKSKGRGRFSMDQVREKYGSQKPAKPSYKSVKQEAA